MATIISTPEEFNRDFCKFYAAIGDKSHTQEQIAGAYKALTLRYLGLVGDTEDIERCAGFLEIAIKGAVARGWSLQQ